MEWTEWSLNRFLLLFVAAAFLLIGIQVTLFHYRQNFHNKAMWGPVLSSPVFFITAVALTWNGAGWLRVLFAALMWIGTLEGIAGFYYHFKGVGVRVGGYELRNFLIGPPVVLPVMFAALSVLGLVAMYWG